MPMRRRAALPTFLGIVTVSLLQAAGCSDTEGTPAPEPPAPPTGGRFEASGGLESGGVASGGRSASSGGRPAPTGGATSGGNRPSEAGAPTEPGSEGGETSSGGGGGGSSPSADGCKDAFTQPIMAFDDIQLVTPIGLVGGGGTEIVGRSYIFPRTDGDEPLTLYAPTDMKLIGGVRYIPPDAPEDYVPDWALAFAPDCSSRVLIELYHVKDVVPALKEAIGDEPKPSSAWQQVSAAVHFEAGEPIGAYLHGINSVAFDFIVKDDAVTNPFHTPERYETSNVLHVICPYTYYTPALRSQFDALLGAPGGEPIPGTDCGNVAIDVPGALAGQWFFDPDPATGRGNLELVDGYGNPHPIVRNPDRSITFGNVGASIQGQRVYPEAETWRDPWEVTDEHCYQLGNPGSPAGWLYYVLVSDSEMKLYQSPSGECPSEPPSSGGRTYYR
jgi:hypothetical protein